MSLRVGALTVLAVGVVFLALIARRPGMIHAADAGLEHAAVATKAPDAGSTQVLLDLFNSEGC